jgi:hypothetical protein
MVRTKSLTELAAALGMPYQRVFRAKRDRIIRPSATGWYNVAVCRRRIELKSSARKAGSFRPEAHDALREWTIKGREVRVKTVERALVEVVKPVAAVVPATVLYAWEYRMDALFSQECRKLCRVRASNDPQGGFGHGGKALEGRLTALLQAMPDRVTRQWETAPEAVALVAPVTATDTAAAVVDADPLLLLAIRERKARTLLAEKEFQDAEAPGIRKYTLDETWAIVLAIADEWVTRLVHLGRVWLPCLTDPVASEVTLLDDFQFTSKRVQRYFAQLMEDDPMMPLPTM